METLYEILGVRPDDDAEAFKRAYRKAAKASHPDTHPDDPDAPIRFKQVLKAYEILRDPEMRADYDQLLELEREQLRATSKRYTTRKFVFDGIAAASLAVVMAGGYVLFADISSSIRTANVVAVPWRGPAETAAVRPAAPTDTTGQQDEPRYKLAGVEVPNTATAPSGVAFAQSALASAANSGDALGNAHGGPASSAARPDGPRVANIDAFRAAVDQAHAKAATDHLKSDSAVEPLDQNAGAISRRSALRERVTDVPRSLAILQDMTRHGVKAANGGETEGRTPCSFQTGLARKQERVGLPWIPSLLARGASRFRSWILELAHQPSARG